MLGSTTFRDVCYLLSSIIFGSVLYLKETTEIVMFHSQLNPYSKHTDCNIVLKIERDIA